MNAKLFSTQRINLGKCYKYRSTFFGGWAYQSIHLLPRMGVTVATPAPARDGMLDAQMKPDSQESGII